MNILLEPLPTTIMVGNRSYDIHSDFRTAIKFELITLNNELDDNEKILQTFLLFFGNIESVPKDVEKTLLAIMDFYRCGKVDKAENGQTAANIRTQIYSFEFDAPYIYAAFLEQYGINLIKKKDLHWWSFKAMFDSLSEDTQFAKIMGYRAMTITNDMTPMQKDFYRRMQKVYAIPVSGSEQDKLNQLEQALLNGSNISSLL